MLQVVQLVAVQR